MCASDDPECNQSWLSFIRDPVMRAVMEADGVTEDALLDLLHRVCIQRGGTLVGEAGARRLLGVDDADRLIAAAVAPVTPAPPVVGTTS